MHTVERRDLDLDGLEDVRLAGQGQVVTVHLTDGAGIGSWDIRPVRHALGAVMRRRPEAYHETLRRHEASTATPGAHPDKTGDGPTSIHDMVLTKEAGLSDILHYDPFERRSGLVRFLDPATDAETWAAGRAIEFGDAIETPFEVETRELDRLVARRDATVAGGGGPAAVTVTKELVLGGDRRRPTLSLKVTVDNRSEHQIEVRLGLEWTTMLLGGGGNPAAWWEVGGTRSAHDSRGTARRVAAYAQGNDAIGLRIDSTLSKAAELWWAPVETVSNSEAGFERVYQGMGLLVGWPLRLAAGGRRSVTIAHIATATRDRAKEERAARKAASPTRRPATRRTAR
jgi:alpha-amylase